MVRSPSLGLWNASFLLYFRLREPASGPPARENPLRVHEDEKERTVDPSRCRPAPRRNYRSLQLNKQGRGCKRFGGRMSRKRHLRAIELSRRVKSAEFGDWIGLR